MTDFWHAQQDGGSEEFLDEFDHTRDCVIDEIAKMLETGDWDSEMAAYGKAFAKIVRRMRTYA